MSKFSKEELLNYLFNMVYFLSIHHWSVTDKEIVAIRDIIQNQPGVTKEWAEGWALRFTPFPRTEAAEKTHIEQFISMLKEAGVSIK